jgi:ADP-ribosylglycohydrolase
MQTLHTLIEKAMHLANTDTPNHEAIKQIGEGWVAEETLAIAIYCVAKHFDNFEKALIASVNHGGDSDSTGAVTGNILGSAIGYEAIPKHFKGDLELHDLILHVADDLWRGIITKM